MSQLSTSLSVIAGNKSWFFYSTCCNRMNPCSSHFYDKTPLVPNLVIYIAVSSHMPVSHIRTISSPNLSVLDTYHVLKLSLNLLSVGKLCEFGLNLHFSNCGVDVQDPLTSKLLGTCHTVGPLFEFHNLQIPSHLVSSFAAAPTLSLNLWNSLFGHVS